MIIGHGIVRGACGDQDVATEDSDNCQSGVSRNGPRHVDIFDSMIVLWSGRLASVIHVRSVHSWRGSDL